MSQIYIKCPTCGHCGKGENSRRGNFLIEVILWFCFIIPGIIYTIWRYSARSLRCPMCQSRNVVRISKKECDNISKGSASNNRIDALHKIASLKEKGLLSDEEFESEVSRINSTISQMQELDSDDNSNSLTVGKLLLYIIGGIVMISVISGIISPFIG